MVDSIGRVPADAQPPALARHTNDLVDALLGQNGRSLSSLFLSGPITVEKDSTSAVVSNFLNDNNANAAADSKILIQTGGASAGDPFIEWAVNGAGVWSAGIDNSDSDAWVLAASAALGTTNVLRATSAGVTVPGNLGVTGTLNVTGVATLGTGDFNILEQTSTPATTGAIRLRKAQSINARNNGNSADLTLIYTDSGDNLFLGSTTGFGDLFIQSTGATSIYGGAAVQLKLNATGIAFFGGTPAGKQTVSAAATDLPTVIALSNQIRSALIAYSQIA